MGCSLAPTRIDGLEPEKRLLFEKRIGIAEFLGATADAANDASFPRARFARRVANLRRRREGLVILSRSGARVVSGESIPRRGAGAGGPRGVGDRLFR